MNELVKALKNFIVRDIIYIIGGASVLLSFLHLFDKMYIIIKSPSNVIYLYFAGLSYVIGYCIQDTASWMRIVTVASYFEPWRTLESLYRCFLHRRWENIFPDIQKEKNRRQEIFRRLDEAEFLIQEHASQGHTVNRERITYLMMVGTTMGPCGLLSGAMLLTKAIDIDWHFSYCPVSFTINTCFDLKLAIAVILISLLFIILGWIKALQLMKNTEELYKFYRNRRFHEYDP